MNTYQYLKTFTGLREYLIKKQKPVIVAELGTGAFSEISGEVVNVVLTVYTKYYDPSIIKTKNLKNYQNKNFGLKEKFSDREIKALERIEGTPFILSAIDKFYNWIYYNETIDTIADCIVACKTSNNSKFLRYWWEIPYENNRWKYYEKDSIGNRYISSPSYFIDWTKGAQIYYRTHYSAQLPNEKYLFRDAIVTSKISGMNATARILGKNTLADMAVNELVLNEDKKNLNQALCALLNSSTSVYCLRKLNPTINSQPFDLQRLPFAGILNDEQVISKLNTIFLEGKSLIKKILTDDIIDVNFKNHLEKYKSIKDIKKDYFSYINNINKLNELKNRLDESVYDILELTEDEIKIIKMDVYQEHSFKIKDVETDRDISYYMKMYLSEAILKIFNHTWPNQTYIKEKSDFDRSEIIPLSEDYFKTTLFEMVKKSTLIPLVDLEEKFGSIKEWIMNDFFKHHIMQFKKRPIAWQLQSIPQIRGNDPAFSCLVYYQKINKDTLPKIRNQYLGPLLNAYMTEQRSLEEYGELSPEQDSRRARLINLIDELEEFDRKLQEVITNGFDSKKLRTLIRKEPIDRWASPDGVSPRPSKVEEFLDQEKMYDPDVNDGVRVNIAPLQKYGLIASNVLSSKDVARAIGDRAEWRLDERQWSREGKLPKPGYWKK